MTAASLAQPAILRRPRRPSSRASPAASFNHLVGAGKQRGRDSEAKLLCCLHVDYEFELRDLPDWQVFWLFAVQHPANILTDLSVSLRIIGSIAHQPTGRSEVSNWTCRG